MKCRGDVIERGALGAVIVACFLLSSTSAFATGFEYMIKNKKSQSDGDPPTLVLQAADIVKSARITIKSSTAKNQTVKLGRMNPGATKEIPLRVKKGTHTFTVSMTVKGVGDQTVEIPPFEFDVVRVAPIKVSIDPDGVDMSKRVIPFKVNRPIDRLEMTFSNPKGGEIGTHVQEFGGRYGSLEATWPDVGPVGGIAIKIHDVDAFWTSVLLEPWWIEIEHKDVNFDSGKYAINPGAEEQKLKDSLAEIREQMEIHKKRRAGMRLYVAGYTDSVGSASDNQRLSAQRACSISRWFQKNGVDMPVYYQGFGEAVLKVKTADEVAEPANRRALYLLGNATPAPTAAMPRSNWKRAGKSCGK